MFHLQYTIINTFLCRMQEYWHLWLYPKLSCIVLHKFTSCRHLLYGGSVLILTQTQAPMGGNNARRGHVCSTCGTGYTILWEVSWSRDIHINNSEVKHGGTSQNRQEGKQGSATRMWKFDKINKMKVGKITQRWREARRKNTKVWWNAGWNMGDIKIRGAWCG